MEDLVPEGFDLDKARRQRSITDPSKRKRCPDCWETNLINKTGSGRGTTRSDDSKYYCAKCGSHFDEPVTGEVGHV